MAAFREQDLDEYSRFAVSLILARFPSWEPFAQFRPRPDGAGHFADFNIPCPSPAVDSGLWISTADEELSVGFHTHHTHFTDYEERLNPRLIEAGIQQAVDVLEERLGVVSLYRGEALSGSRWVALPYQGPLPGLFDGMNLPESLAGIFSSCDRATLRSWLGRFDRDEVHT